MVARPTPTQEELNKIALGEPVELEDDGSGPDPHAEANAKAQAIAAGKHVEAGKPAQGYQTRHTTAQHTTAQHTRKE